MKPVVFLPGAEQEMLEAAKYYESQATGLGVDYLSEVERALQAIRESPTTWPVIEGELRRRLMRRFPFGILVLSHFKRVTQVRQAHLSW
jgi:hypothetical protein